MPQQNYEYGNPRPYAWKTDEYQTHADARQRVGQPAGGPLAAANPAYISSNYRCPNCMSQFLPRIEKRISRNGWIVFAVLLVVFFPLFWVGFLIKEDVHVCPSCNTRVK